ncbi:MAG: hypothetical protein JRH15_21215 [Deltaproteobacteria bacterium]|nr:hypothetical protein [Deltaproteobacteria bacterium]
MSKTRLNISIDKDLAEYVKLYAQENRTTTSEVFTQFILGLKRRNLGDSMDLIYANPDFHKAVLDVRNRLQDGSAEWHSFEEVFAD